MVLLYVLTYVHTGKHVIHTTLLAPDFPLISLDFVAVIAFGKIGVFVLFLFYNHCEHNVIITTHMLHYTTVCVSDFARPEYLHFLVYIYNYLYTYFEKQVVLE